MTTRAEYSRVAILGTGLIGGSFALALRREFPAARVAGFDRADVMARALACGAISEAASDIASAVRGADLVYIALPIGATIDALPKIAEAADANALVTDTGSTKTLICQQAQKYFRGGARFLGGHPMAGRENSGIEHADADLFRGTRYALIASEGDPDPAFSNLRRYCDASAQSLSGATRRLMTGRLASSRICHSSRPSLWRM